MKPYIHPQALCESPDIGDGTHVWAFAHVLPGARIGEDCNICDHVFIEGDARVGDRSTVKCGVQLWNGVRIGDDVFIGPNATFTNDRFPRSKRYPDTYLETVVEDRASIGANATILPGVRIGRGAMIGAGAVITRSVPANAMVFGNPARIVGYISEGRSSSEVEDATPMPNDAEPVRKSRVPGVTLHRLPRFDDLRGALAVTEFGRELPFLPVRCFTVFEVPSEETRGEHAHLACHQFLVCVHGSVRVLVDDGEKREEFLLDSPDLGVHIPPRIWGTQYRYSRDAVLQVFASLPYDAGDYVRNYHDFVRLVGKD
jgi:acetyltransferase-like isoleucine patch superfamily enzyme/dTDP-4-dehydrorhamnose 3,5-epimerase-like enzyme